MSQHSAQDAQAFHRNNRQRLMEKIGLQGVAVFFAAPESTYSHDVHYVYRQNSDLYYLTGFTEPSSAIILAPGHDQPFAMFVMPRDIEKEIWNGFRQGVDGAKKNFGAGAAYTIDQLPEILDHYLADRNDLYYAFGKNTEHDALVFGALNRVRGKIRHGVKAPKHLHDPGLFLNEMRLFKQPFEMERMREAARISADAHSALMRGIRPGMHEYEAEAIIEHHFRKHNARMGYPAIVGGGLNATILHYIENDSPLRDGELLLVDAGAEYKYYNADITRTFPINGKFSSVQRQVYDLVLAAQKACVDMIKPGIRFTDIHHKAVEIITAGLVDLKLLNGSPDQLIHQGAYQKFYMHKTGHWLGGDVHDMGEYLDAEGLSREVKAGMVMTVEPGIYIGPHLSAEVSPEFHHIGIRIEDDILVTETGHENLTDSVPKDADEIEALMGDA